MDQHEVRPLQGRHMLYADGRPAFVAMILRPARSAPARVKALLVTDAGDGAVAAVCREFRLEMN